MIASENNIVNSCWWLFKKKITKKSLSTIAYELNIEVVSTILPLAQVYVEYLGNIIFKNNLNIIITNIWGCSSIT